MAEQTCWFIQTHLSKLLLRKALIAILRFLSIEKKENEVSVFQKHFDSTKWAFWNSLGNLWTQDPPALRSVLNELNRPPSDRWPLGIGWRSWEAPHCTGEHQGPSRWAPKKSCSREDGFGWRRRFRRKFRLFRCFWKNHKVLAVSKKKGWWKIVNSRSRIMIWHQKPSLCSPSISCHNPWIEKFSRVVWKIYLHQENPPWDFFLQTQDSS